MLTHAADLFAWFRELFTRHPPISEGNHVLSAGLAGVGTMIDPMHQRAIDALIDEREGGYVDHPSDPGGATKYGITFRTLRDWRGAPISKDDVRNLTKKEAAEIYHEEYIKGPRLDLLQPEWLFNAVFDAVVNWGPGRGVLLLQKALCVFPQDGLMGPITAAAANTMDPGKLRWALLRERVLYRARRARDDRDQADFIVGWIKRDFEVLG